MEKAYQSRYLIFTRLNLERSHCMTCSDYIEKALLLACFWHNEEK